MVKNVHNRLHRSLFLEAVAKIIKLSNIIMCRVFSLEAIAQIIWTTRVWDLQLAMRLLTVLTIRGGVVIINELQSLPMLYCGWHIHHVCGFHDGWARWFRTFDAEGNLRNWSAPEADKKWVQLFSKRAVHLFAVPQYKIVISPPPTLYHYDYFKVFIITSI